MIALIPIVCSLSHEILSEVIAPHAIAIKFLLCMFSIRLRFFKLRSASVAIPYGKLFEILYRMHFIYIRQLLLLFEITITTYYYLKGEYGYISLD